MTMLNEFKEYLDYTTNLKSVSNISEDYNTNTTSYGRIISKSIKSHYGFKRILTIIARRFIFHDITDISKILSISEDNKFSQIDLAKTALNQWSSSDIVESPIHQDLVGSNNHGRYYSYLNDLLKSYLDLMLRFPSKKTKIEPIYKTIENAMLFWKNYVKDTLSHDFYSTEQSIKNKFGNKVITFDLIVANALNDGPLVNQAVYIPHNNFNGLVHLFETTYRKPIRVFIYISALYAVLFKKSNNVYQLIDLTDLSNWLSNSKIKNQHSKFYKTLMTKNIYGVDTIKNVANKVSFSYDIIKDYKIETKELNNLFEERVGYFLLTDDKSIEVLEKEIENLYKKHYKKIYSKKKKPKSK
jgi:hypothetical protein